MKCKCGHHGSEHDPDAGWCMLCNCKGWEEPDRENEWICEWHSVEAAKIVADTPEKAKVMLCRKCHCVTFHAQIEDKENEDGV